MRAIALLMVVGSLSVLADGIPYYPLVRVPKPNTCDVYGDPLITASSAPVSIERQEDLHIDTPRGRFSLVRTWVGDRVGLGQVTPTSAGDCALPIVNGSTVGLLKSPYGQNFSTPVTANELAINSLTSAVDQRCELVTRVLTPDGDTRFFARVPGLVAGESAWVPRLTEALGEPSRLKAIRGQDQRLTFDWFHEDGRRFRYQQRNSSIGEFQQYRLVEGYNTEGLLLFDVQYGYPNAIPAYIPLADGGANPYPGGLLQGACNITLEPLVVHFPNSQTQLQFVYMPSPSLWSIDVEYPNFDCRLTRIDAVSGATTAPLVEYEYDYYFEQNAARSSSFLTNVNFREGGSANGWRLGQPNHARNSALTTYFPNVTWSKGILVPRPDPRIVSSIVLASSESLATHQLGVYPSGAPWMVGAGTSDSFQNGTGFAISMNEVTFTARNTGTGCTSCCSPTTFGRTITDGVAGAMKTVKMNYYADVQPDGQVGAGWASLMAPLVQSISQTCSPSTACEAGSVTFFYGKTGTSEKPQEINQCGGDTQPVTLLATRNRVNSFTLDQTNFNPKQVAFEKATIRSGATDNNGTQALNEDRFVYTYNTEGLQLLSEMRRRSLLSSSDTVTRYNREPSGQLTSIVQSGYTRGWDGTVSPMIMGTFYRTTRSCVAGSEPPGSARVVEIVGPCQLNTETDTSCSHTYYTPIRELYYYGGAAPPGITLTQTAGFAYNDGRLAATVTRVGGCGGSAFASQFGSYSASGEPGLVVGPNGELTTVARGVELPTQLTMPDNSIYSLEWDRGHLSKVIRPENDSTIYCRGQPTFLSPVSTVDAVDPFCNNYQHVWQPYPVGVGGGYVPAQSSGLSKELTWIADVAPPPLKTTIRYSRFERAPGGTTISTVLGTPDLYTNASDCTGPGCFLRTRTDLDIDGRVKSGFVGTADPANNTKWYISSASDPTSEVVALGAGFDFANPSLPSASPSFCGTGGCTNLERDRLGRIVGRQAATSGTRDCFAYDAQGNVSVITRGCETSSCQSATTTYDLAAGITVSGGPNCSNTAANPEDRFEYVWDDFGRLKKVRSRSNGTWRSEQFSSDPGGNTNARQTSTQAAAGQITWEGWDALGRQVNTFDMSNGVFTQLTSAFWDSPISVPAGCSFQSNNTKTRVATETAPVWNTWFSYDAMGRVTHEQRVTPGASCAGNSNSNSTVYSYTPNGNVDDIVYPYGRVVSYDYPAAGSGLDPNLPIGISVDAFSTPTTSTRLQVISDVQWTPTKAIKSYVFNGFAGLSGGAGLLSYQNKVEFSYGVGGSDVVPTSCFTALSAAGDGAGRLRRIRVTSLTTQAVLYERWYTWAADQIVSIDLCYEGQAGEPLNELTAPIGVTPLGYDAERRLRVNSVRTSGFNPNRPENGHVYAYDSSSNRLSETFTATATDAWLSTVGQGGQLNRVAPTNGTSEFAGNRGYVTFAYDLDGRTTSMAGAIDSFGSANWTYGFGFPAGSALGNGGLDSVLRTFNRDGLIYNYYYDAHNRRVRKAYPTAGSVEDFFYDRAGRLISERSFTGTLNSTGNTIDEYIWLGGMPVVSMRSVFDGAMNRISDWNNNQGPCPRRNEWGHCGMYQLVPDHQGKPVIAIGALGKVTGVGEYDAFGIRNRVRMNKESAHPYANSTTVLVAAGLGRAPTAGSTSQQTLFRARFSFFDANNRSWLCGPRQLCFSNDYVEIRQGTTAVASLTGASLGRAATPFLTQQGLFDAYLVSDASGTGDGVVLSGFDYDRISTSAVRYFPPLRFPGQYYDDESELHENWNRYYDPLTGRYLSPEPMAQDPDWVKERAQEGLSAPTYAYAYNNPVKFIDPTGLDGLPDSYTTKLVTNPELAAELAGGAKAGAAASAGASATGTGVTWPAAAATAVAATGLVISECQKEPDKCLADYIVRQATCMDAAAASNQGSFKGYYEHPVYLACKCWADVAYSLCRGTPVSNGTLNNCRHKSKRANWWPPL